MKRSEMEGTIFTTLMQCYMTNISTVDISKVILKAIEDVGMLPPPSYFNEISVDTEKGFIAEIGYDNPLNGYELVLWDNE